MPNYTAGAAALAAALDRRSQAHQAPPAMELGSIVAEGRLQPDTWGREAFWPAEAAPAGMVGYLRARGLAPGPGYSHYAEAVGFSIPGGGWHATPVAVEVVALGGLCSIDFNVPLACPTKGQRVEWAIMVDGILPTAALGALDAPENDYELMANGAYWVTLAAGPHTLAFAVAGPTGGGVQATHPSTLYYTEQPPLWPLQEGDRVLIVWARGVPIVVEVLG